MHELVPGRSRPEHAAPAAPDRNELRQRSGGETLPVPAEATEHADSRMAWSDLRCRVLSLPVSSVGGLSVLRARRLGHERLHVAASYVSIGERYPIARMQPPVLYHPPSCSLKHAILGLGAGCENGGGCQPTRPRGWRRRSRPCGGRCRRRHRPTQ